MKIYWSSSSCGNSAKYFNTCRNCNNSCCSSKISTSIYIKSNGISVVSSYNETKNTNRNSSVNSSKITKNWFCGIRRNNMADNSKYLFTFIGTVLNGTVLYFFINKCLETKDIGIDEKYVNFGCIGLVICCTLILLTEIMSFSSNFWYWLTFSI